MVVIPFALWQRGSTDNSYFRYLYEEVYDGAIRRYQRDALADPGRLFQNPKSSEAWLLARLSGSGIHKLNLRFHNQQQ